MPSPHSNNITPRKITLPIAYWRPIFDPFFKGPFIVIPLTGNLISIQGEIDKFLARRVARVAGLRADTRMPDEYFSRHRILDTLSDGAAYPPSAAAGRIRMLVRWLLKIAPLSVAIRLLSLAFPLGPGRNMDVSDACLQLLAASFGRRSQDDCLEMALCRYALMRLQGHRCAINIGLLAPSDEMHAWIEYRDHPVLECEDVLVHYQACLKFVDKVRR